MNDGSFIVIHSPLCPLLLFLYSSLPLKIIQSLEQKYQKELVIILGFVILSLMIFVFVKYIVIKILKYILDGFTKIKK